MAEVPISPEIQKSYRDTLNIPDAPSFIDTRIPITPVAVIATTSVAEVAQYMRITDGTDTLLVNTDGSINAVANPTRREITFVGGTSTTTHTVPANRVWKFVYFCVNVVDAASGGITLTAGGQQVAKLDSLGAGSTATAVFPYDIAKELTAGQTIVATYLSVDDGSHSIGYIEEVV